MSRVAPCPFCGVAEGRLLFREALVSALWDAFPVSEGHALIVPNRHIAGWSEATEAERTALTASIERVRDLLRDRYSPDGFNVGFNDGEAAGQTVPHLHVHVIPRYRGDVPDPTGGVRQVIPARGNYLRPIGQDSPPPGTGPPRLLTGGVGNPLLPHLLRELDAAAAVDVAVAFVLRSGLDRLLAHLRDLLARGRPVRLLTGDYLDVTDPDALAALLDLEGAIDVRVYQARERSFHPKAYIFRHADGGGVAFVGSSNLSESALVRGVEWNYRVLASREGEGFREVARAFEGLFRDPATRPLDYAWLEEYRRRRVSAPVRGTGTGTDVEVEPPPPPPVPHAVQARALEALERTRLEGNAAGLVVLATGLGKTWLAAFDSSRPGFGRVLFVAHRDEILDQALGTFRRIRPRARLGRYTGAGKDPDAEVLFASIQTLGRQAHLDVFDPGRFDYIVVDEFHHAAARTYRRLLGHFRPKFLLGLTATPERMDGGDLLGLCGENLVFRCDLFQGVREGLLCPFRYYGVPDEVDYSNIPWRSTRFDEEALTRAVATTRRARNCLEQHRKYAGRRTLAFCCSRAHADFMADFFRGEGLRAAAVHSGPSSAPRATSLEALEAGDLDVVCAVDLFNEGVDLPLVDTVMMLRPTESGTIWMQQLGRGLRRADGKPHLAVIDYIGNHRSFLLKPRTLLQLGPGDATLAAALRLARSGELELPPGCSVTYELGAIDLLASLLRVADGDAALRAYYEDFRERLGQRPTASELFHEGYNPRSVRRGYGSWPRFVGAMGDLGDGQRAVLELAGDFLDALEVTPMTRSFKVLVLLAMLDRDALPGEIALDSLASAVAELAGRSARLRAELEVRGDEADGLARLLAENPIRAWAEGRGTGGRSFFRFEAGRFAAAFSVPDSLRPDFQDLVRELAEWRLAEYLQRPGPDAGQPGKFTCRVSHAGDRPILFLPDRRRQAGVPEGWTRVYADGEWSRANFVKVAVNVVQGPEGQENRLPEILRGWFGAEAGRPGTRHQVEFRPYEDGFAMRPCGPATGDASPRLWGQYRREEIPPLFGLEFNPAVWNVGYVARPEGIFLLVTLVKSGLSPQHAYQDRFLGNDLFQWQSQNRMTRESRPAGILRDHRERGIAVHLFVRRNKLLQGKASPFVYCGEVDFEGWEGDAPITVRWRLREAVPPRLGQLLEVPASGPTAGPSLGHADG